MTTKDLVGNYNLKGSNQDAAGSSYTGVLTLSLDENNKILASWLINNEQKQTGAGFFKDCILVINFKYEGVQDQWYKGTVVYRCLSTSILDGFWSEKHGDQLYLGSEQCFRIENEPLEVH